MNNHKIKHYLLLLTILGVILWFVIIPIGTAVVTAQSGATATAPTASNTPADTGSTTPAQSATTRTPSTTNTPASESDDEDREDLNIEVGESKSQPDKSLSDYSTIWDFEGSETKILDMNWKKNSVVITVYVENRDRFIITDSSDIKKTGKVGEIDQTEIVVDDDDGNIQKIRATASNRGGEQTITINTQRSDQLIFLTDEDSGNLFAGQPVWEWFVWALGAFAAGTTLGLARKVRKQNDSGLIQSAIDGTVYHDNWAVDDVMEVNSDEGKNGGDDE
jgi:hypothetical protein